MKTISKIGLLFILASCGTSTKNFPKPDQLKIAISNGIEIPFTGQDTVVYDSFIGICGNSSKDELNRYYEPHLNEEPYLSMLKKNYNGTILFTGDSLYALMDSLDMNWDRFIKNKIRMSITGWAETNK